MKPNYPQRTRFFKTILLAGSIIIAQPLLAGGKPAEEEPAKKAKSKSVKTKTANSLRNSSLKIYPDIIKREMHVVTRDNNKDELDFFVFDVQGTLVQHHKMTADDHYRISGLARGTYVYRVFDGDTETATGQFEIR